MKKILLIEDNNDIRNNTAEILELANYKVITAENGKTGVEKAIEHSPDLIICDIMMPELDGYGVLYTVQKNKAIKNIPFIFLTAKTDRADFRKGMEQGADDYLTKPFTGTELLHAVDSRFTKIEMRKEDMIPDQEGSLRLHSASTAKDILNALIKDRNINVYKKKQVIYSEGNHPGNLYYILRGKVKVFRTNENGKELATDLYATGDFFGYIALLEGTVYRDTALALEETELAVIPKDEFDHLVNHNMEVAQKFIRLLAKNISEKENHLLGIAYNSLRKKVADALVLLQQKYRNENDEEFIININRESLASIAGTAKESLIRTLGDFRNEKLIDIKDNGGIIIRNPKKLELLIN